MRLGIEHESRHLARFPRPHRHRQSFLAGQQAEATVAEVARPERVIYQGRLQATATLAGREVRIVGLPDFMLPARSGYAIRDSKLNRRVGSGPGARAPPARGLRLALRADLWRAAGCAAGPWRKRRDHHARL